jgi:hypothetical protein
MIANARREALIASCIAALGGLKSFDLFTSNNTPQKVLLQLMNKGTVTEDDRKAFQVIVHQVESMRYAINAVNHLLDHPDDEITVRRMVKFAKEELDWKPE